MMNGRRRRRSTESLILSPILPDDLITQILLRLPVRSLLRFKSVCKSWLSFISDPQFGKSHFDLAASPTHQYKLTTIHDYEVGSLDIDSPLHSYESCVVNLKYPRLSYPDRSQESVIAYRRNYVEFLGSCRGFVLVAYTQGNVFVWNSSTGVHRRIADDLLRCLFLTGFGYDKSTDDYLIVRIKPIDLILDSLTKTEAYFRDYHYGISIFSLSTNSWSRVEDVDVPYMYVYSDSEIGSLLNEALHWLVMAFDTKLHVIIAFDLVERSLAEVPLSHDLAVQLNRKRYYLRVMGECLSLCYPGNRSSMAEIWIMKKYKVQSSWSRVFAFSTCNIPRNVFFPMCFTKHGGIFGSNGSGRLMIFNDKGCLLDQCTVCHDPDIGQFFQGDCGMYRESLLSLPNDFEEASEDDQ